MWATAVAATDRIHSSSEVQQAVIGACSSIRQPWPGIADALEQAFAETPVDRVSPCALIRFALLALLLSRSPGMC